MITRGTLTRYIFKRFFLAILGMFSLCLLIIFLIDFVEILRISTKSGSASFLTLAWITLLRMPAFAEISLPFAVLGGSIGSFLMLSRSSELTIVRAAGMSVWQFVYPGIIVALLYGIFATCVYNPLAATAKAESERVFSQAFGRSSSVFTSKGASGAWLRQDSIDGPSVITAKGVADSGSLLRNVTFVQYDKKHHFLERVEAEEAKLKEGKWELKKAWVSGENRASAFYNNYIVSTNLTPTQVKDALGSANSVSFWHLPNFIELAEAAGLEATKFKVQYQLLLSRPLVLISMVLLAATCSLKGFRFGNIQSMVIGGLAAGFVYFIAAEVSRSVGLAGLVSPTVAVWTPVFMACCLTMTVLLHQEDG